MKNNHGFLFDDHYVGTLEEAAEKCGKLGGTWFTKWTEYLQCGDQDFEWEDAADDEAYTYEILIHNEPDPD